jgi:hypothetical protein
MYVHTYECMYICKNECMYICKNGCMYICKNEWMYIWIYECMYLHLYLWMHVGMNEWRYICMQYLKKRKIQNNFIYFLAHIWFNKSGHVIYIGIYLSLSSQWGGNFYFYWSSDEILN